MLLLTFLACSDVTSPENGARLGPVIQLQDWFTSCFLLEGEGEVVLFDACWRSARLEKTLGEQGLAPSDVTHVLVTHGHDDHVGALEVLPNARVWALAAEAELVETATDGAVALDRTLADGESLSLAGQTVEVFAVPGHTDGSAVFLVGGTLVFGDAGLVNAAGELVAVPEDRSDDPAQAEESVRALAERLAPRAEEIDWIAPAHSAAIAGFAPLADF
jgi:glyoxylase-like metal-dependent hydrolase (beta-lactamase superfamily II)